MRNYISYFSGVIEFVDNAPPFDVFFSEFVAAEDEDAFNAAAQFIFDTNHDHFAWTTVRVTAQKMYFRMDKESVLWVLNGMTKNGDVRGFTPTIPDASAAYRGQFDRTNAALIPNLTKFFVAESPRRLKRPV